MIYLQILHQESQLFLAKDMVDNGLALLSKRPMTPVGDLPVTGAQHAPAAQHVTGPKRGAIIGERFECA